MKRNKGYVLVLTTLLLTAGCESKTPVCNDGEHVFAESDNYIELHKCEKCGKYFELEDDGTYAKNYEAKYSVTKYNNYSKLVESIKEDLAEGKKNFDEIKELVKQAEEAYHEVELMDFALTMEVQVHYSEENEVEYNKAEDDYNKAVSLSKSLDYAICESTYANEYFKGIDIEEYKKELKPFIDPEISSKKSKLDAKGNDIEYDYVEEGIECFDKIEELVNERNDFAKLVGYDNYYEYASKHEYGREYTSEQLAVYRNFIKEYIVPYYFDLCDLIPDELYDDFDEYDDVYFVDFFAKKDERKLLSDYLKTLKSDKYNVDFYSSINKAFKEGRIIQGHDECLEGAFTLSGKNIDPVMYYSEGIYYSSLNTFVHEAGHFNYYDPNEECVDYDIMETHSQSNEFLFLRYLQESKYLSDVKLKNMEKIYLSDILSTVIEYALYDEIEEYVYKDYCEYDEKLKDGIAADEYDLLIEKVFDSYELAYDGDSYVFQYYLTADSTYEISYSISLVPILSLYAKSKTDYDYAKECYYKILTFVNHQEELVSMDYVNVLKYAGYDSPFEEQTYKTIINTLKFQ